MTTEPKADLAALWEAAQRVAAAADHGDHATNASCQREWDATDRELAAIGIPLYDRHAAGGPGRAWWTAQNAAGLITGRWAESLEEAVIAIGASGNAPIVWCVADTDLSVSSRYADCGPGVPRIYPVTREPIPGPLYAAIEPLF